MKKICFVLAALLFTLPVVGWAVQYVDSLPMGQTVTAQVGEVQSGGPTKVPLITWGGDIATILANGNGTLTSSSSIFGKQNLQLQLVRMDDFTQQVESYVKGEMPYLRGTMGMLSMASEVLNRDARTKPVVIYQHTWSNGGDCLVVKSGINSAKDLKGKTIALQAYGPHVAYLAKLLRDAGLQMSDVHLKWVRDLTGSDNTPAEALYDKSVDAAMVIIPDGLMLTSAGKVGTGAEGSVQGARIMLSTKSANRIIADVYAVRSDYLEAHKDEVQRFVHGLLLAEQELKNIVKTQAQGKPYQEVMRASAKILLDSVAATGDAAGLYADCEYVGLSGNVKFFTDSNWPRNFTRLSQEIQSSFITVGLLKSQNLLSQANWDYASLGAGISGAEAVTAPRFNPDTVAQVVAKKQAMGTLTEGELFSFEVFFKPNQNDFPVASYQDAFDRVVELASTYGGAVITVEGHSDPLGYLRKKKENATDIVLKRTQQAAKNLSMTRAIAVRQSAMEYAASKNINLDQSQFTVVGHGIMQPKSGMCGALPCPPKTKEEWLGNMRVVFRIIQIEAEESAFRPLD
jgi:outer membrane protein OmpA-like peptidoglycan-associated protein